MSLIREVAAIVVAIAQPVDGYTHAGTMAHCSVLRFVAGSRTAGLIFRFGTVCAAIATLLHFYAGTGYLEENFVLLLLFIKFIV